MKTLRIKSLIESIALIGAILAFSINTGFAQVSNIPKLIGLTPPIDTLPTPVPNPDPYPQHYYPVHPVPTDTVKPNGQPFTGRMSEDANTSFANETTISLQPDKLEIYPNPSNGQFTVNFHTDIQGNAHLRIINIIGKEIFSENLSDFTGDYNNLFDLSDKGRGLYILSIEQNNKVFTKKIVIN